MKRAESGVGRGVDAELEGWIRLARCWEPKCTALSADCNWRHVRESSGGGLGADGGEEGSGRAMRTELNERRAKRR